MRLCAVEAVWDTRIYEGMKTRIFLFIRGVVGVFALVWHGGGTVLNAKPQSRKAAKTVLE